MKSIKETWQYVLVSAWLPNVAMVLALAWLIASDQGWFSSVPRENARRLERIEQRLEKTEQIQKERQAIVDEFHRLQREKK